MTTDLLDFRLAFDLLELAAKKTAGELWDEAFKDAISHIMVVAGNNPGKPLKAILLRPDVQEVITEPFVTAGVGTIDAVRKAWEAAAGKDVPTTDLNLILKNVRANTKSAPARIRAAVLHGPKNEMGDRLTKLAKEMRLRAEYAVQHAQKRGKTAKDLHEAPKGATKTWAATDPQCGACKALVGVTIPINEEFDPSAGGLTLGTFGKLLGPPRHPNCKCTLIVTK